jgi:hypothetical protein
LSTDNNTFNFSAESREHSNPFDDPFGLFYNFSDSSNNSYCKDLWNLDLFSETSTTILPKTTYEFKKIIKETSDDPFAVKKFLKFYKLRLYILGFILKILLYTGASRLYCKTSLRRVNY